MVNVRALPSDLARIVLDYLYSEGLQESYDVFLQESPHLGELRDFPTMGILPLGAKSLQVIVEEYYELMSQDTSKMKNANDTLYKLWKRFDALLVQIKHRYKGSGAIATISNELASQSVRSRYSLNRLHHERMQMERDHALRQANPSTPPTQQQHPQQPLHYHQQQHQTQQHQQQQHQQQHQQEHQQHHQHPKHGQRHHNNSPFRRQQRQAFEPDVHSPMMSPPFPTNQQSLERSCDTRSSTPRSLRSPMVQEGLSTSPSQSVTSTQSQFVTPTKSIQHDRPVGDEKVVGKSPKRKSAPPKRKPHQGMAIERFMSAPSTSAGAPPVDEIQNLPSPWGSLCNNRELMEKLADNINKVLPAQEMGTEEELPDEAPDQANLSGGTDESHQSGGTNNSQALEELLSGMVSNSMMDEFVDMTSVDPAFNSLFALFNTDRDKFLHSERKKLQLSASEVEEDLNSSRESEVDSSMQQDPSSQPNQLPPQQSSLPSSSQTSTVTIISQGRNGDTQLMRSSTGHTAGHTSEVVGQSNISSQNQDRIFLSNELVGLSSSGQDPFPNMVVRRSPSKEDVACTSTALSRVNSVKASVSANGARSSEEKSTSRILGSFADIYPSSHVRELSFIRDPSPAKTGAASTSQGTPHGTPQRRKAKEKVSHSPRIQHRNETTPPKRPIPRTPERIYSPEEKAVARLLTKLPTTPTKDSAVASSQQVVINGKKVVILRRGQTEDAANRRQLGTGVSGNQKERTNVGHRAIPPVGQVNGVQVSGLPGHSRAAQPPHSGGGEKTVAPAKQTNANVSETNSQEEMAKAGRNDVPHDAGTKQTKKGVKRERKDADKTKGSKKTKRSKSKPNKDLGFPVNLDVDKFLSQINYTS